MNSKNNSEDHEERPVMEKSSAIVDTNDDVKTDSEEEKDVTAGTSDDDEDDGEGEGGSTRLFRIDSGLLPFPEKLMILLDGNTVSGAMWWLPDGDSFCIIPTVFAEQVLDKHFSGTKFESFTRKLNRFVALPCGFVFCKSEMDSHI
jgi:HSF-type DNA-binding